MSEFGKHLGTALAKVSQETLTPTQDERLARALGLETPVPGRATRGPWIWATAAATAMAAVVLAWFSMRGPADKTQVASVHTQAQGAMVIDAQLFGWAGTISATRVVVERGDASLALGASQLTIRGQADIGVEPRQLRVHAGTVRFKVAPAQPRPVVTAVSHGRIVVRGTEFTVTQGAASGTVTLHEGSIEFVANDGTITQLRPGQTLAWPAPRAPETNEASLPPDAAAQPATARAMHAPPTGPTFAEMLRELEALRARRDTSGVLRYVDEQLRAGPSTLSRDQRAMLGLERILALQAMGQIEQACAAISQYLQTASPDKPSTARVADLGTQLHCGEP